MKILVVHVYAGKIITPAIQEGEIVTLYGKKVKVAATKGDNDCNECEIHHLCNRDTEFQRMVQRMCLFLE